MRHDDTRSGPKDRISPSTFLPQVPPYSVNRDPAKVTRVPQSRLVYCKECRFGRQRVSDTLCFSAFLEYVFASCVLVIKQNELILAWRNFHLSDVFYRLDAEEGVVCDHHD